MRSNPWYHRGQKFSKNYFYYYIVKFIKLQTVILLEVYVDNYKVTFHTRAKVVGIMRQNACLLAFCVQNLL